MIVHSMTYTARDVMPFDDCTVRRDETWHVEGTNRILTKVLFDACVHKVQLLFQPSDAVRRLARRQSWERRVNFSHETLQMLRIAS